MVICYLFCRAGDGPAHHILVSVLKGFNEMRKFHKKAAAGARTALRPALLALLLTWAGTTSTRSNAQGFNFTDQMAEYLRYLPPVILEVSAPERPPADAPIEIRAHVIRFPVPLKNIEMEDYVDTVSLYYTTDDGQTWEETDMEQDSDNEEMWVGEIPEQPEDTIVRYRITAQDSAENVAMEMPPDLGLPGYTPNADPPDDPFNHLTRIANSKEEPGELLPNLDVTGIDFGYDADRYYFRVGMVGRVDGGTLNPVDARAYLIAVINGPLLASIDIVNYTWLWYYCPLIEMVPIPGVGPVPGVGVAHVKSDNLRKPYFDKTGFTYTLGEHDMSVSIDRALIGQSDTAAFLVGNIMASGESVTKAKITKGDISPSVVVYFRDHRFTVGKAKEEE